MEVRNLFITALCGIKFARNGQRKPRNFGTASYNWFYHARQKPLSMHCMRTDSPSIESLTPSKTWWVYLLACRNGRTYAGIAVDVHARFQLHVQGKGAKFTRANPPLAILGMQAFESRSTALKAEHALKQLEKTDKLMWAKQNSVQPKIKKPRHSGV